MIHLEALVRNAFSCQDLLALEPWEELVLLHFPLLISGLLASVLSLYAVVLLHQLKSLQSKKRKSSATDKPRSDVMSRQTLNNMEVAVKTLSRFAIASIVFLTIEITSAAMLIRELPELASNLASWHDCEYDGACK